MGEGGIDWIDLNEDRDRWRALVNVVMNLGGFIKCKEFLDQLRTGQLLNEDSAPWSKKVSKCTCRPVLIILLQTLLKYFGFQHVEKKIVCCSFHSCFSSGAFKEGVSKMGIKLQKNLPSHLQILKSVQLFRRKQILFSLCQTFSVKVCLSYYIMENVIVYDMKTYFKIWNLRKFMNC